MNENLERFLRYIKIDTQSDDESTSTPSAKKEYDLLNLLRKELLELGISMHRGIIKYDESPLPDLKGHLVKKVRNLIGID